MPELTAPEFIRLANNFYLTNNIATDIQRIAVDSQLINYINTNAGKLPKYKVAFCWICVNQPYWEFAKPMIEGAKQFFLPGHNVDYFLWSDMPDLDTEKGQWFLKNIPEIEIQEINGQKTEIKQRQNFEIYIRETRKTATVFPVESIEWPMPTLMRHSLFLQQEEKLKEYDYIFYCDVDMYFVNVVGDEILGKGLTAALHPCYATRKEYWPPYEPNEKSASYIPRSGKVIDDGGKPRFMPMYFAGGLQGGKADKYIEAMKAMKKIIDKDFIQNYIPIWNDESVWNRYLFENPPDVVLTPSYIYPDSLIKEYYEPLWGCSYTPKLITITKKFSISKEGGEAVQRMIQK